MKAAASIWPAWPRRAWISGCKGAVDPMIASVDRAEVTSADCAACASRRNRPASAKAVENWVPLIRASPSFGPSATGARPAGASACRAGHRSCPDTRPRLRRSSRRSYAPAAPDRPRRRPSPCAGITGVTPAGQHRLDQLDQLPAHARCAPAQADSSFSAIISRAWARGHRRRPRRSNATGSGCAARWRCLRARSGRWPVCQSRC